MFVRQVHLSPAYAEKINEIKKVIKRRSLNILVLIREFFPASLLPNVGDLRKYSSLNTFHGLMVDTVIDPTKPGPEVWLS